MEGANSSSLSISSGVPLPGLETTPTEQCQLMLGDQASHCGLDNSTVSLTPSHPHTLTPLHCHNHTNAYKFILTYVYTHTRTLSAAVSRISAVDCGAELTTNQNVITTTFLQPRGPSASWREGGEGCVTRAAVWSWGHWLTQWREGGGSGGSGSCVVSPAGLASRAALDSVTLQRKTDFRENHTFNSLSLFSFSLTDLLMEGGTVWVPAIATRPVTTPPAPPTATSDRNCVILSHLTPDTHNGRHLASVSTHNTHTTHTVQ